MITLTSKNLTCAQTEALVKAVRIALPSNPTYQVFEDFICNEASMCFNIWMLNYDIKALYLALF